MDANTNPAAAKTLTAYQSLTDAFVAAGVDAALRFADDGTPWIECRRAEANLMIVEGQWSVLRPGDDDYQPVGTRDDVLALFA